MYSLVRMTIYNPDQYYPFSYFMFHSTAAFHQYIVAWFYSHTGCAADDNDCVVIDIHFAYKCDRQ